MIVAWIIVAGVFVALWFILSFSGHATRFLEALDRLGGEANTLQIHDESRLPVWRVHVIAHFLEEDVVVRSRFEPGGPERGGRCRRVITRVR